MKKILAILMALALVAWAVPAFAGGCADREYGGECYNPGQPNTGSIGTSTYPWGEGYYYDLTVTTTLGLPTGSVTSAMIADMTRTVSMDIKNAWAASNSTFISGTTSPQTSILDGIPAICWNSSDDAGSVLFTFVVDADYSSTMAFHALVSSSSPTTNGWAFNWSVYVNHDGVAFDAAAVAQTAVSPTLLVSSTNEVVDFSFNATSLADISAGDIVTVVVANKDTRKSATAEIKAVWRSYTAVR